MSIVNKILKEGWPAGYEKYIIGGGRWDDSMDMYSILKDGLGDVDFSEQYLVDIERAWKEKYGEEFDYWTEEGELQTVNLADLSYGQHQVFTKGTQSHGQPITVVEHDGRKVLVNGNHRTAEALMRGIYQLQAKVIYL